MTDDIRPNDSLTKDALEIPGAVRIVKVGPQTWQDVLPTLFIALDHGSAESRRAAYAELKRMAKVADKYLEQHERKSE